MADYDLRDLCAPLEAMRSDVKNAYARLDCEWEAIAAALRQLPLPCTVSYAFLEDPECPPNNDCLEFRKWKGAKRLCITAYSIHQTQFGYEDVEDVTPYEEWSAEQRLEMLQHIPNLFDAARDQVQGFIDRTRSLGQLSV